MTHREERVSARRGLGRGDRRRRGVGRAAVGWALVISVAVMTPAAASPPAPGSVDRIDATSAVETALAVSRSRFAPGEASWAVIARSDVFADALASAPLAAGGPLLLSSPRRLSSSVEAEIDRVLPTGPGNARYVYLVGGMSDSVSTSLARDGYTVIPLAGPSRVETAVAIAREVRNQLYRNAPAEVVLARAFAPESNPTAAWADAISGGAWATKMRVPLLITPTDELHPAVLEALEEFSPKRVVLLGGNAALSTGVERSVRRWKPFRVSGADRAATAADTMRLWAEGTTTVMTSFLVVPGFAEDGWAYGLAAAGLAADELMPPLLVDRHVMPTATHAAIRSVCGPGRPGVRIVGGLRAVDQTVEDALRGTVQCHS